MRGALLPPGAFSTTQRVAGTVGGGDRYVRADVAPEASRLTRTAHPSAPAPVVAPRTGGISTTHTLPVPAREQEPASGSRPPVLAPPELTIPAVTPVGADGAGGVGAVPVIALTTVLVAATVAAVSLLLMRRGS